MLNNIVIRPIEEHDFDAAKKLIKSGLLEYGGELFKYSTLKSAVMQVCEMWCFIRTPPTSRLKYAWIYVHGQFVHLSDEL